MLTGLERHWASVHVPDPGRRSGPATAGRPPAAWVGSGCWLCIDSFRHSHTSHSDTITLLQCCCVQTVGCWAREWPAAAAPAGSTAPQQTLAAATRYDTTRPSTTLCLMTAMALEGASPLGHLRGVGCAQAVQGCCAECQAGELAAAGQPRLMQRLLPMAPPRSSRN